MITLLSYSGGKDSTACLIYCLKKNIKIDEIIYVSDFFPYPRKEMKQYFRYIQEKLSVKITTLPFIKKYWLKKNNYLMPTLKIKYCKRLKAEIFSNYIKIKYGYFGILILMGIRKNESNHRHNYKDFGDYFWNKRLGVKYLYYYPIFDLKDPLKYLKKNDVDVNPIYEKYDVKRIGCKTCIYRKDYDINEARKILLGKNF